MSVRLYIEGGGEGQLLDTLFRQGWRQFLKRAALIFAAETGRISVETVA